MCSLSVSCSLLTLVWQRSTETTALDSTYPTEKTRTWLAQHAMPQSMHTWALNRGLCTHLILNCQRQRSMKCFGFFFKNLQTYLPLLNRRWCLKKIISCLKKEPVVLCQGYDMHTLSYAEKYKRQEEEPVFRLCMDAEQCSSQYTSGAAGQH